MIESIEILKRVQSLKSKIDELEASKKRRKQDIENKKSQIENKKALSEKKHEEKISAQKEIDKKELDLKTNEGEVAKYNIQLNSIKTNKEYTALRSEIGVKQADMSILEDKLLETMSTLENVIQEYSKATEDLRNEEENLKDLIKSVEAEFKETDAESEKIKNDQKKYLDSLDEHTLRQYNQLSNIKGGKAVVAVVGNVCGGCSMNITTQTLNLLMGGKELVFCRSCSRMLYLDEKNN
jgi:predicted  nucleic acid-binding Zn-ribbon protein